MRIQGSFSRNAITSFALAALTLWIFETHAGDDKKYKFLEELPESFCEDDGKVNAGTFGIHFRDLNTAKVLDSLYSEAKPHSCEEEFQEALCETLLDPKSCFVSYALLNQLYPECACRIVSDGFWQGSPIESGKIPIKVLSGGELVELVVDFRCFSEISYRYWRKKLGLRSPLVKQLERDAPGWLEKLRLEKLRSQNLEK